MKKKLNNIFARGVEIEILALGRAHSLTKTHEKQNQRQLYFVVCS